MSRVTASDLHFARGARPILRGISFEHHAGRVLTFLGPSGCGKTTLLWLLARLLKPDRGTITYEAAKPSFGMVFQDGGLWEHLSVRRHLETVLRGHGLSRDDISKRINAALERSGLNDLASRRPGELSGGERQRLALARALVVQPQWLFLDEPTSQLDGPARDELIQLLGAQLRSTTAGIFLATHQVDLAMRLSDEIAILHDGIIAQIGPPADVYSKPITFAIAKLLGPASEINSESIRGYPHRGGRAIVRPQQLQFVPCDSGSARVSGCHFSGGFWQIEATLPHDECAIASSSSPIAIGTTGSLQWISG